MKFGVVYCKVPENRKVSYAVGRLDERCLGAMLDSTGAVIPGTRSYTSLAEIDAVEREVQRRIANSQWVVGVYTVEPVAKFAAIRLEE
jgi:hypothetical protein